ncbi:MAG: sigma-54-dependent Fis family transcriptional regulator [Paludibacteraceae bacterium]|nr:sigma-54-dependent Fis family transcriptional regulator [Paludibacteraceae bacterium]MBN2786781.1 sigma-54-dependent Fis family transcriptional regulator [Paludibacteraceae bacterium]
MQLSDIQSIKQRFGIIGNSPLLNRAIDVAVQVSPTDLSVLIIGESGVGKENLAQIIHQYSHRKHGTYIAVNCGAIPKGTVDSELFGHEKGSYTDAKSERKGYFEAAEGGTIFLDEVGELPSDVQAKLLRVLEAGEYMRLGSSKVQKSNVRIIAATNLNMAEAINDGRFREDLYYRLNTIPITVPPLRDRKEDITLLFRKFASDFSEKYHRPAVKLTEDAQELLSNYYFPGNIRQLKNITEQISVIEQNRDINAQTLRLYLPNNDVQNLPALYKGKNDSKSFNSEREILYQVLFDMKKDMNDLKQLVHSIITKQNIDLSQLDEKYAFTETNHAEIDTFPFIQKQTSSSIKIPQNDIEDTEEYVEESLSLLDAEKDIIKKALSKHNGKRKYAAEDLHISERTLYRKIKEYGLE